MFGRRTLVATSTTRLLRLLSLGFLARELQLASRRDGGVPFLNLTGRLRYVRDVLRFARRLRGRNFVRGSLFGGRRLNISGLPATPHRIDFDRGRRGGRLYRSFLRRLGRSATLLCRRSRRRLLRRSGALFTLPARAYPGDLVDGEWAAVTAHRDIHLTKH